MRFHRYNFDMRTMVLIILTLLGWSCGGETQNLSMTEFVGTWEVDLDRTMEEAQNSPKFDAAAAEGLPETIRRLMGTMKIQVSETEIVYLRGAKRQALSYELKSSDPHIVTVAVRHGDEEASLVFRPVDQGRMNFKSSVSDDMDYYVWRRVAK